MCDEHTDSDNEQLLASGALTRRHFGMALSAASLAAIMPAPAHAVAVKGRDVLIDTPDGKADAYYVAPSSGKHPAVLIWPDVMSLRPAFRLMAKRLAESGYAVLVINPYYRAAKAPVMQPGENWSMPEVKARIMPYRSALTRATNETDAKAFVGWLDKQKAVDTKRGIATTGYCMGGPMVMVAAATVPERIKAAASFHGGGLATDKTDSPHLLIPKMQAYYLVAVAENDDQRTPQEKVMLRKAFDDAKLFAEIEVYKGAQHGWCPPDSQVYNKEQAERAWARQLALFKERL